MKSIFKIFILSILSCLSVPNLMAERVKPEIPEITYTVTGIDESKLTIEKIIPASFRKRVYLDQAEQSLFAHSRTR